MLKREIEKMKNEAEFALNSDDIFYKNEFLRKILPNLFDELAAQQMLINDLRIKNEDLEKINYIKTW